MNGRTPCFDEPGLLVRIDEPVDGSTRFGGVVPLRGWIAATAAERAELSEGSLRFYVERISDRGSLLFNGLSFIGTEVADGAGAGPRLLQPIAFADEVYPLPADEVGAARGRLEFQGQLDLTAWSEAPSLIRIIAKYQRGLAVTLSNQVVISLGDERSRQQPYGGFTVPEGDSALRAAVVLFEVWAAKCDDPPQLVELLFGEKRFEMTRAVTAEQSKVDALPDIGLSGHARFVAAVPTHVLLSADTDGDFQQIPLRANVRFESGVELAIAGPTIRLALPSGARDGGAEIEALRVLPTGNIELHGVLTMPGVGAVRAFLEARNWRIELHSGASVPRIEWASQSLLDTTEPLLSDTFSRFRAVFSPDALGPTPGAVRLVFERGEVRVSAGPAAQLGRMSSLMARAVPKQAIATMLCRVGHRRSYPVTPPARNGAGRWLVASPNLSAVEGAPKVLCDVVTALSKHGAHELLVASTVDGALRERYEGAGIPVVVLNGFSGEGLSWERYHRELTKLAALEEERPFAAVLANVIDSYWAVDYARRRQLPSAWIVHESVEPAASFAGVDARLRLLFFEALRAVRAPIFVAERTAELFRPFLSGQSRVIENGIDGDSLAAASGSVDCAAVRKALGIEADAKVVSIIGTTTRRKGQDIFLQEMAALRKRFQGAPLRFLVVGAREVPFLKELRTLARELSLEDAVVFVPEQPGAERFFAVSDVVVIASREESAPLVSLEAFAHGVPLVSTRVFGLADQIRDEVNALAFDVNAPGALASQVERLLCDQALRERLTVTARADVRERFSRERAMAQYCDALLPLAS